MKNILILISSALFIIIIVGVLFGRSAIFPNKSSGLQPTPTTSQAPLEDKVQIIIDYGGNETVTQEYNISENETAFSVLEKSTLDNHISLETETYDFGIFVKALNGLESDAEMVWIYYINGQSGQVSADQQQLDPGDIVEWKYIAPSVDE